MLHPLRSSARRTGSCSNIGSPTCPCPHAPVHMPSVRAGAAPAHFMLQPRPLAHAATYTHTPRPTPSRGPLASFIRVRILASPRHAAHGTQPTARNAACNAACNARIRTSTRTQNARLATHGMRIQMQPTRAVVLAAGGRPPRQPGQEHQEVRPVVDSDLSRANLVSCSSSTVGTATVGTATVLCPCV